MFKFKCLKMFNNIYALLLKQRYNIFPAFQNILKQDRQKNIIISQQKTLSRWNTTT